MQIESNQLIQQIRTRKWSLKDLLWLSIERYSGDKIAAEGEFKSYQFETAYAIFENIIHCKSDTFTMLFARQTGKTQILKEVAQACCLWIPILCKMEHPIGPAIPYGPKLRYQFPDGMLINVFGPKDETTELIWDDRLQQPLTQIAEKFGYAVIKNNTEGMVVRGLDANGKSIQLWRVKTHSLNKTSRVEGETANFNILDEAQFMTKKKIVQEVLPTGANSHATMVMAGTIDDVKCYFDDECDNNKGYFPHLHFEFDYTVAIKANLRNGGYEAFVNKIIAKHGMDSDEFRKKFRLIREYAKGMLVDEQTFVTKMARPNQSRWRGKILEKLPPGHVPIASVDIANIHDWTVAKAGTANWNGVQLQPDGELSTKPECLIHFSATYPHGDFEREQFPQILSDFAQFPALKKEGIVVVDATGDRGAATSLFQNAGYTVFPVVFSGGKKTPGYDDAGELQHGSKFSLCVSYCDALSGNHFGYAADELYMGTLDYFRAIGTPIPNGRLIIPPSPEYNKHKLEATNCFKKKVGEGLINLISDPENENAHDDEIIADVMLWFGALYHRIISLDQIKFVGSDRTMSAPDSIRSQVLGLFRTFKL